MKVLLMRILVNMLTLVELCELESELDVSSQAGNDGESSKKK